MGLTTNGSVGAITALSLPECVSRIAAIAESARSVRDDVIVLCHGGPIAMPEDAQYVFERVPAVHGFYGASSVERLPTEIGIKKQVQQFTQIRREAVPKVSR
jgi:predicted TIM-barrel enzyme